MKRFEIHPIEGEFDWGTMSIIELGESGRNRRLVYVPYHAPDDAEFLEIGTTRSGRPKIIKSESPEGWLAVVSGSGTYTRGTYGTAYCLESDKDKIQIIEYGKGAFGQAGRIGSWYEFLIAIPDDIFIRIRPAGGSHKIARYWLFFGKEKAYKISDNEIDLFCEARDIEFPSLENLIDLIEFVDEKK